MIASCEPYAVLRNSALDFAGESYAASCPNLHKYPATMLPQIGDYIFRELNIKSGSLLDPYCGSGSSFVSGLSAGLTDMAGYDLNPLAIRICKSKFTKLNISLLHDTIIHLRNFVYASLNAGDLELTDSESDKITNFGFWFSDEAAAKLRRIKYFINRLNNIQIKEFIEVAFAETVREVSYTRNNEFKIYRIKKDDIPLFHPDVYGTFFAKAIHNFNIYELCYYPLLSDNSKLDFYNKGFTGSEEQFDVVLTSPPYGDSKTTVAYGQFSFFANAWLGVSGANSLDSMLMGGKKSKDLFQDSIITSDLELINAQNPKRALEISGFYYDLASSIKNVAAAVAAGGYAIYVAGNRLVQGVTLSTDQFIAEQFEKNGFRHIITYERLLGNKRMPTRNSPTNEKGRTASTMLYEYVIICKKII